MGSPSSASSLPVELVVAEDPDFPPPGAPQGPMDMSGIDLVMLGHAHIDLGYRWDIKETIHRIAPDTFRGVLEVMDRTPGFTFCQSQMFLYDAMEKHEPRIFARMRAAIQTGSWEVIGGAWCEYDAVLPSGESVIRQHLQGMRYAADSLGIKDNDIGFVPDSFIGHASTLPQILAGCGIRYYLFGRGLPEGLRRAFRWVGPDGSSVVAYLPFGPYSNPPLTPEHLARLKPYAEAAVGSTELALYGAGDHGGGPREADLAALAALRSSPTAPRWRYGRGRDFFPAAFAGGIPSLRAYAGSLRAFATGALTSQAQTKRQNRICEHLLVETEAIAGMATMLQRKPAHPRVDFCLLWRELLTQQFHDILPGTSVASVYRQALAAYEDVRRQASLLREDALERIRCRIDTRGEGYPLLVVNTGLGPAAGVVRAAYPSWIPPDTVVELIDEASAPVAAECEEGAVSFGVSLRALSYRLYRAIPCSGKPRTPRHETSSEPVTDVTRGSVTVRFDPATGDISGVEAAGRAVTGRAFALELLEEADKSTSWTLAPTGAELPLSLVEAPRVVHHDRFRTVVRTVSRTKWSTLTREATIYEHFDRVELTVGLDWHESDALLKLRLRPAASAHPAMVRTSLAHGFEVVRDPSREFCLHDWVDLEGEGGGFALFTDGAYGADVTDRGLGVSVIRTARDMDPSMGHGAHTLRLSLVPYRGAFRQSRNSAALWSSLCSLHCRWDGTHGGALMSWGRIDTGFAMPKAHSFFPVDRENVELCAVKLPEEHYTPDAVIVRVRELDGLRCRCLLRLPLAATAVWAADHLERPDREIDGQHGTEVSLDLEPYQIRTVVAYL